MKRTTLILLLLLLIPAGFVAGQGFVNQRSVIVSSGLATSPGFRVRGTVGQPATDRLTSSNYSVSNGFYFVGGSSTPTMVEMGEVSAENTLTPFWRLTTFALLLFSLSFWLRRRTR